MTGTHTSRSFFFFETQMSMPFKALSDCESVCSCMLHARDGEMGGSQKVGIIMIRCKVIAASRLSQTIVIKGKKEALLHSQQET